MYRSGGDSACKTFTAAPGLRRLRIPEGGKQSAMTYIGLDIHKKTISYCARRADGVILQQGTLGATRAALDEWVPTLPVPWTAGMEATLFTAWVYDHLLEGGMTVKVAHPAMLKAIFAGKRKNDRIDAQKLADLLRCDYSRSVIWLRRMSAIGVGSYVIEISWFGRARRPRIR